MAIFPQGQTAYLTQDFDAMAINQYKASLWFNAGNLRRNGTIFSHFNPAANNFITIAAVELGGDAFEITVGESDGVSFFDEDSDAGGSFVANTWTHLMYEVRSTTEKHLWQDGSIIASITTDINPRSLDTMQIAAFNGGSRLLASNFADVSIMDGDFEFRGDEHSYTALAAGYCPYFISEAVLHSYSRFITTKTPGDESRYDEITGETWVRTGNTPYTDRHPNIIYPGI